MVIQWCLKGIPERPSFGDTEAADLLAKGIQSNWLFNNPTVPIAQAIPTVQSMLSLSALLTHVNNYAAVRTTSPYISLSAGVVVPDTALGTRKFPAWKSAVDFATARGRTEGYIYRVWTIVTPKPSPELRMCRTRFGILISSALSGNISTRERSQRSLSFRRPKLNMSSRLERTESRRDFATTISVS